MDLKQFLELKQLPQGPTAIWFIYGLAALLILYWVVSRIISRRRPVRASGRAVVVKGNNPGIVVTGKVVHIVQHRADDGRRSGTASRVLGIAANISGILGLLLAALAFYLDHWA